MFSVRRELQGFWRIESCNWDGRIKVDIIVIIIPVNKAKGTTRSIDCSGKGGMEGDDTQHRFLAEVGRRIAVS